MSKHLERDLEQLQDDLLTMATLVEQALQKSIRSLQKRDVDLADVVIAGDPQIDQDENHIEEECLKILALHQPVAVDLRRVAAALKISHDLERMGDLAENIAERAQHLAAIPDFPIPEKLQRMTDLTTTMFRQSLQAFTELDTAQARRVCRLDDEVDRYNREIIADLTEMMKQSPEMVEPGLSMFSAVRHVERIADHATHIAQDVVYLVEGIIIRHHPEAAEVQE